MTRSLSSSPTATSTAPARSTETRRSTFWFHDTGVDPDAGRQAQYRIYKMLSAPAGTLRDPVASEAVVYDDAMVIAAGITGQPREFVERELAELLDAGAVCKLSASRTPLADTYPAEIELA